MSETRPLLVHGFVRAEVVGALAQGFGARAQTLVLESSDSGIVALATELDTSDPVGLFNDPKAVTALALDHAEVLAIVARDHDVAPLRLGALTSGRAALRELCQTQSAAALRALRAVSGQIEFGLRALPAAEPPPGPTAPSVDGRSYLRARATQRSARAQRSGEQRGFCAALTARLCAVCQVKVLTAEAEGLARGRLLNLACLVDRRGIDAFAQAVETESEAARKVGLILETTGPWPPYSFVSAEAN